MNYLVYKHSTSYFLNFLQAQFLLNAHIDSLSRKPYFLAFFKGILQGHTLSIGFSRCFWLSEDAKCEKKSENYVNQPFRKWQ